MHADLNVGLASTVGSRAFADHTARHRDVVNESIYRWIEHRALTAHHIIDFGNQKFPEATDLVRAKGTDAKGHRT